MPQIRVLDAITNTDMERIRRTYRLEEQRIQTLASQTSTTADDVRETIATVARWLRGPSDELLRQYGITVTKIEQGLSHVEYEDFEVEDPED